MKEDEDDDVQPVGCFVRKEWLLCAKVGVH
jgi:hypothetical protein